MHPRPLRVLALLLCLAAIGCERTRPAERTGEALDKAGTATGAAIGRAAESTGNALNRAGEWVRDRTQ